MGGIWGSRDFFIEAFTEIAGYKAGVVLSEEELFDLLRDQGEISVVLDPNGPGGGRVHSSSFEDGVTYLLYKLGNTSPPNNIPISALLFHKYKNSPKIEIYNGVMESYLRIMSEELYKPVERQSIDPTPFIEDVFSRFGGDGAEIAVELISGVKQDLHRSPWGSIRNVEWRDSVELGDLFKSAGLQTQHGTFFDQRYIDYLSQNFDEVDKMHWRKFEGFTAEFFAREGYHVVLGPGSNDDGVDLRVFPEDSRLDAPPMIIVQCKRQKAKIEKALVKSVYADVLHEAAGSGLIVTTSTLAPGAETTRSARNYPVETADREKLRAWLQKLRSA